MTKTAMLMACVFGVASLAPLAAQAADAASPYGNVDHKNDAGNSTGNNRVDALNRGQLDQNQPGLGSTPAMNGVPATPSQGSAQR